MIEIMVIVFGGIALIGLSVIGAICAVKEGDGIAKNAKNIERIAFSIDKISNELKREEKKDGDK